ncbi:hypothetical protein [Gordonia neofelifaecis]|uniref:Uncharacterized protein n=1 Tax=Gordonia neofelifaecis NRRL B-59395 TaxID=644548 RepID=F1YLM3_9ACTN|nr:hypothetical protein [Gordonia neofelifaecis]EGD54417.1 hypothetical protein SCNU_14074 [Gordonia neofelifaecis NRRL B-59395]
MTGRSGMRAGPVGIANTDRFGTHPSIRRLRDGLTVGDVPSAT